MSIRPERHGRAFPGRNARRQLLREDAIHAAPGKVTQQAIELGGHARQVGVVPEPRLPAAVRDARLAGIDLPRVEIEDAGPALGRFTWVKPARNTAYGQQAEIAAA